MSFFRRPFQSLHSLLAAVIAATASPRIDPYSTVARRSGIRRYTSDELGVRSKKRTTVAAEKRKARKRRNQLRHKAHLRRR